MSVGILSIAAETIYRVHATGVKATMERGMEQPRKRRKPEER
jgi:hypothetical protein